MHGFFYFFEKKFIHPFVLCASFYRILFYFYFANKLQIMPETYHIRIKKEYAAAIIEDLQKMDAVDLLVDENTNVPDWQIELGKKELENINTGNTELVQWTEAKKNLKL